MENKLVFRPLKEEDYETISEWWKWWWKGKIMEKDILPDNGKGGFMIEKSNQLVVCGFLYITNSKTAFLGWIVSNPEYREKDRRELIEILIDNIENISKQMGYKYMFTSCGHKQLIETHENLGWRNTKKPSYELIKKI